MGRRSGISFVQDRNQLSFASVLHGQDEIRRLGRPCREVPEEVCKLGQEKENWRSRCQVVWLRLLVPLFREMFGAGALVF